VLSAKNLAVHLTPDVASRVTISAVGEFEPFAALCRKVFVLLGALWTVGVLIFVRIFFKYFHGYTGECL
jgi:hypothetical protein